MFSGTLNVTMANMETHILTSSLYSLDVLLLALLTTLLTQTSKLVELPISPV